MAFPNANFVRLDVFLPTGTQDGSFRQVFFREKEHLKNNGWTIERSGDGLAAFSSSGDVINSDSSGANGVNVTCWYVASCPDGNQIMRRWSSSVNWDFHYSPVDGFTGGDATTAPTATDVGDVATNISGGGLDPGAIRTKNFGYVENASPYRFAFFRVNDDSSTFASQEAVPRNGWGRDFWRAYDFAADDAPDRSVLLHNDGGGISNFNQGNTPEFGAYTDASPPATTANFQKFTFADGTTIAASGGIPFDTSGISTRELVLRRGGAFPIIPALITWRRKNIADIANNAARVLEDEIEFGGADGRFGDSVTIANLVIPWDASVIWDDGLSLSNRHYRSSARTLCTTTPIIVAVPAGIAENIAGGFSV